MESTLEPRFPPARVWGRIWANTVRAVVSAVPDGSSHFGAARGCIPKLVGMDAMGGAARALPMDVAARPFVGLGSGRGRLSGAACRGVGLRKLGPRVARNGRHVLAKQPSRPLCGGRLGAPPVPSPGLGRLDADGPNRLAVRRIPPGRTLGRLGTMRTAPCGNPHNVDTRCPLEKQPPKRFGRLFPRGWDAVDVGIHRVERRWSHGLRLLGLVWFFGMLGGLEVAGQPSCWEASEVVQRWAERNAPVTEAAQDSVRELLVQWQQAPLVLNALPPAAWVDLPFWEVGPGAALAYYRSRGGALLDWSELDFVDGMDSCTQATVRHYCTLDLLRQAPVRALGQPAAGWSNGLPTFHWNWRLHAAWGKQLVGSPTPWKGQAGWGPAQINWFPSPTDWLQLRGTVPGRSLRSTAQIRWGTYGWSPWLQAVWTPEAGQRWTAEWGSNAAATGPQRRIQTSWNTSLPGRVHWTATARYRRNPWELPQWDGWVRGEKSTPQYAVRGQWNWTSDSGWRVVFSGNFSGWTVRWSQSGKWPVGADGLGGAPMLAKRPTSELVELAYRQSNPWGRWSATAAWVSASPGLPVLYGTQPYGSSPWVLSAEWSKSWKSWSFFVRGALQPGLRPARDSLLWNENGWNARGSFRIRYAPTWTLKLRQKSG